MPDLGKDRIDDLPPGRELDALVAEKVMGWTLDPEGCWLDRENDYADTGWGDEWNTYNLPVWSPSVDIAAAWTLLEKAIADGGTPQIYYSSGLWWVILAGLSQAVSGETAPLAICHAVLQAYSMGQEP